MKKLIIAGIVFLAVPFWGIAQSAQVPQALKYQAVARDTEDQPIANTNLLIRLYLKEGGLLGTIYYQEEHSVKTSSLGVFDLNIGQGSKTVGDFSQVPWQGGLINLVVEISLNAGADWLPMGESPMLSVPYALFAGATPRDTIRLISDHDGLTRVETEFTKGDRTVRIFLKGTEMVHLSADAFNTARLELISGLHNTVVGQDAMPASKGNQNTAFGWKALNANSTGMNNTAVGSSSLLLNTEGVENTALGINSLVLNTTGFQNTAIGTNALYNNNSGYKNTAIGWDAMYYNANGSHNIAIGSGAMAGNEKGLHKIAIGFEAMSLSKNGYGNIAIGDKASCGGSADSLVNAIVIGTSAYVNASNQVRIGNSKITSIGGFANWTNVSDARFKKDFRSDIPGLAFIMKLQPVSYRLDLDALAGVLQEGDKMKGQIEAKEKIRYSGFVAQDVEQAAASIGYEFSGVDKPERPEGLYGLRYAEFTVPLVKAVQELQAQIEQLKSENEALKSRLDKLEADAGER